MDKVLVTGATGLLGKKLCELLTNKGIEPIVLSRDGSNSSKYRTFEWNLQEEYINEAVFDEKIDAIIHLAGAGLADQRWTDKRKQEIIESRVGGIRFLGKYIAKMPEANRPKTFISAAAIGIYGNAGEGWVDETTPIRDDSQEFLVQCCVQWEAATQIMSDLGLRTAVLRLGIVLSKEGGALAKMLPSYKWGVGAYFGTGKQFYSWIHIADACRMLLFLVENKETSGIFNGVAPYPVTNKKLAALIAEALNQKALLIPVPKLALWLGMGEMAAIVTDSARVNPTRLKKAGFEFGFPKLLPALQDLLKRE